MPVMRAELEPGAAGAAAAAASLNDEGMVHFGEKRHAHAARAFAEASRLCPSAPAFAANAAAAHLASGDARRAAEAARRALEVDPEHARALCRLADACLSLAEAAAQRGGGDRGRALLREARDAYQRVLLLQPGNAHAHQGQKEAALAWAAEFDSDEE